jgi:short-subunit dehydrogenase
MLRGVKKLAGRVAVVTGAASGIGRAVALELAARGCHLALVDVNEVGLADTARAAAGPRPALRVTTHLADVSKRARMEALVGEVVTAHERVHVLVNNAGVAASGLLADQSLDDFEWLVGINFWGVVYGCKLFLPHLLTQDEAHIVNLSSIFGVVGIPTQMAYNAAKYAVRGVSDALFSELYGTNVGVTCVHPGGVRTNIVRAARTSTAADAEAVRETERRFERSAMSPERAGRKIVRAIERNKPRLLIGAEAYLLDYLKRLAPIGTQRLIARVFARGRKDRRA